MTAILNRRSLLTGIAATGFAGAMTNPLLAADRKSFFARVGLPIGLQLYTLGDEPTKDLDGVLKRVAAIGYREAELPSLFGKTPAELKAAADRAGIELTCIHLAVTPNTPAAALSLTSPTQRIVDDLGALGIKQAVLPIMLFPKNLKFGTGESFQATLARGIGEAGEDLWKRTAALLNEKAAALKPHGISLGYHNHNIEFLPLGKTSGWEILARETDPRLVSFEIDVGWIAAAGLDPVAFLTQHKGRVRQLHVKDVKPSTKTNYALSMDPAEIGSGKLDWTRILPAAHKAGCRHFYVEQEPPFAIPRMDAVAKSYAFLSRLRA